MYEFKNMDTYMTACEIIKQKRIELKMTQDELANLVSTTKQNIKKTLVGNEYTVLGKYVITDRNSP